MPVQKMSYCSWSLVSFFSPLILDRGGLKQTLVCC